LPGDDPAEEVLLKYTLRGLRRGLLLCRRGLRPADDHSFVRPDTHVRLPERTTGLTGTSNW